MVFMGSPFDVDESMYSSWGHPFFAGGPSGRRPDPRSYRQPQQPCYEYDPFTMLDFFGSPQPRYQRPNNRARQQRSAEHQSDNTFHRYRTPNPSHADDSEVEPTSQRQIPSGHRQEAARSGVPSARNSNTRVDPKYTNLRHTKGCQASSEEESTSEDEEVQHATQPMPKQTQLPKSQQKVQELEIQQPDKNATPKSKPTSRVNSANKKPDSSDASSENSGDESPVNAKTAEEELIDSNSELPPETKKLPPKLTNAEKLKSMETDLMLLEANIEAFSGGVKDKEYIYIDEMLTKALLTLDAIDSEGNAEIRSNRKQLVNRVQSLVDRLELKVRIDVGTENKNLNPNENLLNDSSSDARMDETAVPETENVDQDDTVTEYGESSRDVCNDEIEAW